MTLEQALAAAYENHPTLAAAEAAVAAAQARLLAAGVYPHNPELELEAADRRPEVPGAGGSSDRGLALEQELELAGQRRKRRAAARSELAAAKSRLARARRELAATLEEAFADALATESLLRVARAETELTGSLLAFERRRLEAGAGTAIDLHLARAADGRAEARRAEAEAAWWTARATLAEAAGLDPRTPPVPLGEPAAIGSPAPPPLATLGEAVLARREDLVALRLEVEAAEQRLVLARALAAPTLRVGLFRSEEEGDTIFGARVRVALPLFDRGQGVVAEAQATVQESRAALAQATLAARREIAQAHARYRAARAAATALGAQVTGSLEESLDLLRKALEAGKTDARQVLLLRGELIDGRREAIAAAHELIAARAALELTLGSTLPPHPSEDR